MTTMVNKLKAGSPAKKFENKEATGNRNLASRDYHTDDDRNDGMVVSIRPMEQDLPVGGRGKVLGLKCEGPEYS